MPNGSLLFIQGGQFIGYPGQRFLDAADCNLDSLWQSLFATTDWVNLCDVVSLSVFGEKTHMKRSNQDHAHQSMPYLGRIKPVLAFFLYVGSILLPVPVDDDGSKGRVQE